MKRILSAALALLLLLAAAFVVFRRPWRGGYKAVRTVSDKAALTLIIDAGHGGEDGGAVSPSGLAESGVNLDIAMRIDALAAFFGVKTVMTRESEEIAYSDAADTTRERKTEDQRARLELIRSVPNAVFISIHQNEYTTQQPFGAQALYAPTEGSRELALELQELLISSLDTTNRRAAAQIQDTIFLMNSLDCPAVLIECAFLSNPGDEAKLRTEEYRLKLAAVITAGFLQNRGELSAIYGLYDHDLEAKE
ncbi:MAG: N-acetylmuramoyl-L-alanine amidase [Oscillospiraceae bacterium]|jgi:N-acetylmuramoyl-L-alanine amidase|nr:N-acetylmuramoyl-L-alanine amidase [Oscillospiraceae bacterium]